MLVSSLHAVRGRFCPTYPDTRQQESRHGAENILLVCYLAYLRSQCSILLFVSNDGKELSVLNGDHG